MGFAGSEDQACKDPVTSSCGTERLSGSQNKSLRSSTPTASSYLCESELQKLKKAPPSLVRVCQVKYKHSYGEQQQAGNYSWCYRNTHGRTQALPLVFQHFSAAFQEPA